MSKANSLEQLKAFCDEGWHKAQNAVEAEGYSYELTVRTDVFEEVLAKIAELQKIEDADVGFVSDEN